MNDPLFAKEAVNQYTVKKSSKQDNSKKRISTLLQTQSDKEEKRDEQTRDTLHVKKTIIWINAKPSWKRLLRKESNSWPTKHYAMAGIKP